MGGNPIIGHDGQSAIVQPTKARRDLVLQHGSDQDGVVQHLGDPWRTSQPGLLPFQRQRVLLCTGRAQAAGGAVLGKRGIAGFRIPTRVLETFRICHAQQPKFRCARNGQCTFP